MKKIKIIHIAAEVSPFSKTGGLGDVTRSLPKALFRLGHKVAIITPLYSQLIDAKKHHLKLLYQDIKVIIDSANTVSINIWRGQLINGLPVYFIENKEYFSKYRKIYVSEKDNIRFLVFNVSALKVISLLELQPDIIHCHDWHTGLIPYFIKNKYRYTKNLEKTKTIFTIHNLSFQMGKAWYEVPLTKKDYGRKKLPLLNDPGLLNINFVKRAILSADIINTVSERYREEIMTKKFGQDLHHILKNREDRLFGIINGIDYNAYNPQNDKGLYKNYSFDNFLLKNENKKYLQKKVHFTVDEDIPLFCSTSRVAFQKGFDIILKILPVLLKNDIQIIFLGDGDIEYIKKIKKLQKKYPKKIAWFLFDKNKYPKNTKIPFLNQDKETLLYAASDFFILPSHHEPCGINQMIAMRYGAIPIVRDIGGLYDTVLNFNPSTNKGTGFSFKNYDDLSFFGAIIRALENYKYKKVWYDLIVRAMKKSSSWEIPAQKYVELYKKALRIKN
ncbi:MAG TPA: glycogen/starch synthase [bacterium]|nr:glycogen/starch synthase [bacterium]